MNEIIEQDDRYPEWLKAWNAKATEIDQQIINFFSGKKENNAGAVDEATTHIRNWWDTQPLEPNVRSEYVRARADDDDLRTRVEDRISRLTEEGRLNVPPKTYKAGE